MRRKEFMPKEKTVGELFLNSDSWYETRTFQRPYRWTDKETVQLWDDLWGAFERNENYFLGGIFVVPPAQQGDIHFDVVDGQQRLTALAILFAVVRDHYPRVNGRVDRETRDIKLHHLHRAIDDSDPEKAHRRLMPRAKLASGEDTAALFFTAVTDRGATRNAAKKRPTKSELEGGDPKHNYIRSVQIFKERLAGKSKANSKFPPMSAKKRGRFVTFLFRQVSVLLVQCSDADFAVEMVNTISGNMDGKKKPAC